MMLQERVFMDSHYPLEECFNRKPLRPQVIPVIWRVGDFYWKKLWCYWRETLWTGKKKGKSKRCEDLLLEDRDCTNTAINRILDTRISLISKWIYTVFSMRRRQLMEHFCDISNTKHLHTPPSLYNNSLFPIHLIVSPNFHRHSTVWSNGCMQSLWATYIASAIVLTPNQNPLRLSLLNLLHMFSGAACMHPDAKVTSLEGSWHVGRWITLLFFGAWWTKVYCECLVYSLSIWWFILICVRWNDLPDVQGSYFSHVIVVYVWLTISLSISANHSTLGLSSAGKNENQAVRRTKQIVVYTSLERTLWTWANFWGWSGGK